MLMDERNNDPSWPAMAMGYPSDMVDLSSLKEPAESDESTYLADMVVREFVAAIGWLGGAGRKEERGRMCGVFVLGLEARGFGTFFLWGGGGDAAKGGWYVSTVG